MMHLFQAVVTMENVPFYPLYQIHTAKTEIMKLFNCSRYLLDKAKKTSYFQQINQNNFTKSKLDSKGPTFY